MDIHRAFFYLGEEGGVLIGSKTKREKLEE